MALRELCRFNRNTLLPRTYKNLVCAFHYLQRLVQLHTHCLTYCSIGKCATVFIYMCARESKLNILNVSVWPTYELIEIKVKKKYERAWNFNNYPSNNHLHVNFTHVLQLQNELTLTLLYQLLINDDKTIDKYYTVVFFKLNFFKYILIYFD